MNGPSRTEVAVRGWAAALPAAVYDVRVVPEDNDGPALRRRVSEEGLLRLLPWLRAANVAGCHIYARPASPAYALIDDLDEDGLDALRGTGHRPAVVVITSPSNHQAWLRLPGDDGSISPDLSSAVARLVARRFDGDPGAASSVQVGRLPGFTNRKAIYADGYGRHPFVLLRAAPGGVDPRGGKLLRAAASELAALSSSRTFIARPASDVSSPRRLRLRPCTPEEEWAEGCRRVLKGLSGMPLDRSRLDYAIASRLLGRGAPKSYVRAVLLAGERAGKMGGSSVETYVDRTMEAVTRGRSADHGRWRARLEKSNRGSFERSGSQSDYCAC